MGDRLLLLGWYSPSVSQFQFRTILSLCLQVSTLICRQIKLRRDLPSNLLHKFFEIQIYPTLITNISPNFDHHVPSPSHPLLPKSAFHSVDLTIHFSEAKTRRPNKSMLSNSSTLSLTHWVAIFVRCFPD